ncbi:MAG: NACHT domain-containing protein [Streptosporangiaceae bacterium]
MLAWLLGAAIGPAAVAVPVNWAADALASSARRWFRRLRRNDQLSNLLKAATGTSLELSQQEFDALRRLLEDRQTWQVAGQGSVADLADRIAACLPAREGRTLHDSQAAALIIARGLLEFAAASLEPAFFQQLLVSRLERMETGQANALEAALTDLHADLAAQFAAQGERDAERFSTLMGTLTRVLNRLPPGPARRGDVAAYLSTLIGWLDTDPWPRDQRFAGPVLTAAAIERKLRISVTGQEAEHSLDADELARRCLRLVVLGGPGSGKTWLAKRLARRCAEDALDALVAGENLDEIDLPIFTTCSQLFQAAGDIRNAVVSSAFDQFADLGSSRLSDALRTFFTERNAPTLLVIDSLDEAHGKADRLRQAGTLPWRIILTSRNGAWNHQLVIDENHPSHQIGDLEPLRYPDDVEPFIRRWFASQAEWGDNLTAQIARRPGLQQAATVPLILAFYCLIGGSEQLPEFRRDIYASVLKRMLTGRWRGSSNRQPDLRACLSTLRAWAWAGATCHPRTEMGTWSDDIATEFVALGEAETEALDHVAAALGPPDPDTGTIPRRFVHRSLREYLVAEQIASLPADQAAEIMLPHLWFDSDWEYTAPAAIAMHPEHDALVRKLICRAARSEVIPDDLSVIDAGLELRGLLTRVTAESGEAQWTPGLADVIGRARAEFVVASGSVDFGGADFGSMELGGVATWHSSNWQAREALQSMLVIPENLDWADALVPAVLQVVPTAEDKRQVREVLLRLLAGQVSGWAAAVLADGVAQLDPSADDRQHARRALLGMLDKESSGFVGAPLAGSVARLEPTPDDRRQARHALVRMLDIDESGAIGEWLADRVVELAPTSEDKRQARSALLRLLIRRTDGWTGLLLTRAVLRLQPTAAEERKVCDALLRRLASPANRDDAPQLVDLVVRLTSTADDKSRARDALLALLGALPPLADIPGLVDNRTAEALIGGVLRLADTLQARRQALNAVIRLLADANADAGAGAPVAAMVHGLVQLASEAEGKPPVRQELIRLLDGQATPAVAVRLAEGIVQLAPTADDIRHVRETVLALLGGQSTRGRRGTPEVERRSQDDGMQNDEIAGSRFGWAALAVLGSRPGDANRPAAIGDASQLASLALLRLTGHSHGWQTGDLVSILTAADRHEIRQALLQLLTDQSHRSPPGDLTGALLRLDPTQEDKRQARTVLLGLLGRAPDGWAVTSLAEALTQLEATTAQQAQARDAILGLLAKPGTLEMSGCLIDALGRFHPTAEDKRRARALLLSQLTSTPNHWQTVHTALATLAALEPTERDRRDARAALTSFLAASPSDWNALHTMIEDLITFDPGEEDMRRARAVLLGDLATHRHTAMTLNTLADLAALDPTAEDLSTWRSWKAQPTAELLSAARRNSPLADWLAALPALAPLSE